MILSISERTDIPAFYSDWMYNRFDEGYVYVCNPYNKMNIQKIQLNPDNIECIIFMSKNYRHMIDDPRFNNLIKTYKCYFYFTITPYDNDIEQYVPSVKEAIHQLQELSNIVGKEHVGWRFDPILLTEKYTKEFICESFDRMAAEIAPYVNRCVFSFIHIYEKTAHNLPEAHPISYDDKLYILNNLARYGKKYGLFIQTCGHGLSFSDIDGINRSACISSNVLYDAFGVKVKQNAKHGNNRLGCGCLQVKNIGDYGTCMNKCRYCYATADHEKARSLYMTHNPQSPMLYGNITDDMIISEYISEQIFDDILTTKELF